MSNKDGKGMKIACPRDSKVHEGVYAWVTYFAFTSPSCPTSRTAGLCWGELALGKSVRHLETTLWLATLWVIKSDEPALSLPILLSHDSPDVSNEYSLFTKNPWEILQYAELLLPVFPLRGGGGSDSGSKTARMTWFWFQPSSGGFSVSFLSFLSTFRCLV